jgi:hypothetical protein
LDVVLTHELIHIAIAHPAKANHPQADAFTGSRAISLTDRGGRDDGWGCEDSGSFEEMTSLHGAN